MKTVQITLTLHPAADAFISSEMRYTNAKAAPSAAAVASRFWIRPSAANVSP